MPQWGQHKRPVLFRHDKIHGKKNDVGARVFRCAALWGIKEASVFPVFSPSFTVSKDEAIRQEQALYIQRNMPLGAVGAAFSVWTIVFLFRDTEVRTLMLGWAGLFSAGVVHTLIDFRRWRRLLPAAAERWLRHTAVAAGCASALLGGGAFLVLQVPQPELQLFYLCVIFVVSVMSIFAYGPYYPTFLSMVMPVMLLTMLAFALGDSPLQWATAASQGIIIVVVLYFARTFNRVFTRSVELRFENHELVERLRVQIGAAESANMAKSRFLAAASHDLRQPMHALNLYLGAMSNIRLSAEAKPLLNNASQCAAAMDDMFGALLDVSSLDAGAVKPELSVFPIASVLDRVRLAFTPAAHDKGLQLDVRTSAAFVHSDAALVERILGNLVSNAVRYTAKGRILIGCRSRGQRLVLEVYDTGPGISADKQALIFEEFYQVSNAERDRSQGLGLGLAIVERLARLLSTPVSLRSVPGKGSVFRFDLPRADAAWGRAETKASAAMPAQPLRDTFIVVVDDEKFVLDATRAVLELHGSFVVTAGSGAEAILQLGHSKRVPDALICDYRLRAGETGAEVAERIREEFNTDIPAILITGDTAPERILELQATGLPILHKPIHEKDLLAALSQLLPFRETDRKDAAA